MSSKIDRKNPRVDIAQKAQLRFRGEDEKKLRMAMLINISEGGMCVGTDVPLRKGKEYIFELRLPFLEAPVIARGEMRWQGQEPGASSSRGWMAGIKLVQPLPKKHQDELSSYITRRTQPDRPSDIQNTVAARLGIKLPILMVVDANPDIENRCKAIFAEDAEIVRCEAGFEAVDMAGDWKPNLILLNLDMEGAGALTIIPALREDIFTRDVPVCAISEKYTTEQAAACRQAGTAQLLLKSMGDEILKERLCPLLKKPEF